MNDEVRGLQHRGKDERRARAASRLCFDYSKHSRGGGGKKIDMTMWIAGRGVFVLLTQGAGAGLLLI